jgi:hypothetical protein
MTVIRAERLMATDGTRIVFGKQPAGAPFPIKMWFCPGELGEQEFIYPPNAN